MAHLRAEIRGNGTKAVTCTGTKSSGITGHVHGWSTGARVMVDHESGRDVVRVYRTRGTASDRTGERGELVAEWTEEAR